MRFGLFRAVLPFVLVLAAWTGPSRAAPPISDAAVWNQRGIRHFKDEDHRTAITCFETASRLCPEDTTIRFNLASAHARLAIKLARGRMTRAVYLQAVAEAERAIALVKDHAFFHSVLGFVHQEMRNHQEAHRAFERAAELDPDDSAARVLLGNAAYELDDLNGAIEEWRSALGLDPGSADVAGRIEKADRERALEDGFRSIENARFRVRYDPLFPDGERLAHRMLAILEDARGDVLARLPRRTLGQVSVVVYPPDEFRRLMEGCDWTGGLYDGKIRVPFPRFGETEERFRALATHEYVHAVLYDWTAGCCPAWLNEGLAQVLAGEWTRAREETARRMARDSSFLPLADLEESFLRLDDSLVEKAYVESYLVARHIIESYTDRHLHALLDAVARGLPAEDAVRSVLHTTGEDLLRETFSGLKTGIAWRAGR
ncbi:MAG: tetratricopeptide repeat protein [Candidatus Eisenbacteria bacterium]